MRARRDEVTRSAWGSGTATQRFTGSRGPSRAWRVRAQRTAGRWIDSAVPGRRGAAVSDLLNMNVMVMSQKPKFIEMTNEYEITDENGTPVGTVRQEGQSKARKLLRLVSSADQFLTHKLAVRDAGGAKVLELVRPAKVFKSTVEVLNANGTHVGKIVQENIVGKKRFRLDGPVGRDPQLHRCGELALVGLRHQRRRRQRGRPDHQEVDGDPARGVHDRGPVPAAHLRKRGASDAPTNGGVGRGRRHGAEAGRHGRCGVRRARLRYLSPRVQAPIPRASLRFARRPISSAV
jgi:uncharacterized protein YxjI